MFSSHVYSGYDSIELYIMLREPQLLQVVDPLETEQVEVDVVDKEEEYDELEFDEMFNDDSEDDGIPGISANEIYTPPPHMTNFNMGGDESSSNLFFNPYMQSDENLKEKDKFRNREECI